MPRLGSFRFFVMNHLIHHRGQLSVYLRMLDVPVPGMYGPSADDM
ncbi:MAG TPA: DinB family protein [Flavisolibacter sp.]|nr:DinB family protein [Flavisolibacter sp.]